MAYKIFITDVIDFSYKSRVQDVVDVHRKHAEEALASHSGHGVTE